MFSLMKKFLVVEGAFLDCIWYFLFLSKPSPPHSNSRCFCDGYLRREKHTGENQLLVQKETDLLDKWFPGLLTCARCEYPEYLFS